jgi:hypothetical protein
MFEKNTLEFLEFLDVLSLEFPEPLEFCRLLFSLFQNPSTEEVASAAKRLLVGLLNKFLFPHRVLLTLSYSHFSETYISLFTVKPLVDGKPF